MIPGYNNGKRRREDKAVNEAAGTRSNIGSTNAYTPNPAPDALSIVGLIKSAGKITGYKLSDGRSVSRDEGVNLAKQNKIKGVAVAVKGKTQYLRGLPDDNEDNNLGNLPSVSQ